MCEALYKDLRKVKRGGEQLKTMILRKALIHVHIIVTEFGEKGSYSGKNEFEIQCMGTFNQTHEFFHFFSTGL